jgi:hypothetical protein
MRGILREWLGIDDSYEYFTCRCNALEKHFDKDIITLYSILFHLTNYLGLTISTVYDPTHNTCNVQSRKLKTKQAKQDKHKKKK